MSCCKVLCRHSVFMHVYTHRRDFIQIHLLFLEWYYGIWELLMFKQCMFQYFCFWCCHFWWMNLVMRFYTPPHKKKKFIVDLHIIVQVCFSMEETWTYTHNFVENNVNSLYVFTVHILKLLSLISRWNCKSSDGSRWQTCYLYLGHLSLGWW